MVSVIIPTYNREALLRGTLESLCTQMYPSDRFEIIVCDNNSTDGTRSVVEEVKTRSSVPIVYLFEKRQGVHYARNTAAVRSLGEVLYFTDDDMVAEPQMLTELMSIFSINPEVASATGKILPRFVSAPPRWVTANLTNYLLSLTEADKPDMVNITHDEYLFSCHQAIRRDVFFRCGGYNPENTAGVWVGDGETGLNIKMQDMGCLFAYVPTARTWHVIPPDRMTLRYLVDRLGNDGSSDSYTEYRWYRRKDLIIGKLLKRDTVTVVQRLILTLWDVVGGRKTWRFLPAFVMYFYRRHRYDMRLYRDDAFREMAEVDNWLDRSECDVHQIE